MGWKGKPKSINRCAQCWSQQGRLAAGAMHSGRWGVEQAAWEPPRNPPARQNGRYVPDVDELDYTSAPRYHEASIKLFLA